MNTGEIDLYIKMFETAAANAASFELRIRMVAGKIEDPSFKKASVDMRLGQLFEKIRTTYRGVLEKSEWDAMSLAIKVRNKLIHGEFHKIAPLLGIDSGGAIYRL